MTKHKSRHLVVGSVRPSQMMFTYGIGSIVDLPNLSVIVMGLDDWPNNLPEIVEPRLLTAVQYVPELTGVQELRSLPRTETDLGRGPQQHSDEAPVGAPVAMFPRWWVCPACRQLAPLSSGIFELSKTTFPPDKIGYHHTGCSSKQKNPQAIPARILVACDGGHLDDFPWLAFVHRNQPCRGESSSLKLGEFGVSGEVRDLEVRCSCGQRRRLADAFGRENRAQLGSCTGRRPHLRDYDEDKCERGVKAIALGASNLWFPITLTALSIPTQGNQLLQLVENQWGTFQHVKSHQNLELLRKVNALPSELKSFSDAELFQAIQAFAERPTTAEKPNTAPDVKSPEYRVLSEGDPSGKYSEFQTRRLPLNADWSALGITDVLLVERLREVQAMVGFARLDAVGELTDPDQQSLVRAAPISRRSPTWVPAAEMRGEGLFLRFEEARMAAWESRPMLDDLTRSFLKAHRTWREKRGIQNPDDFFPGLRYILMHSFSHALMRQLALEAGYSAASLKERIYARSPHDPGGPMSGVLIYTAASDSEGTLGGLLGLGENENDLYDLVTESLQAMSLCAGDPLCAEHGLDETGRTVHAAACHACLFAPETSCERGNRYLDRGVLVATSDPARSSQAFFDRIR